MAIRYKKHLDELGHIKSAVVMSAPDTQEGHKEAKVHGSSYRLFGGHYKGGERCGQ